MQYFIILHQPYGMMQYFILLHQPYRMMQYLSLLHQPNEMMQYSILLHQPYGMMQYFFILHHLSPHLHTMVSFSFFHHNSGTIHVFLCCDMSNIMLHLVVKLNFWWHLESSTTNSFQDSMSDHWTDRFFFQVMQNDAILHQSRGMMQWLNILRDFLEFSPYMTRAHLQMDQQTDGRTDKASYRDAWKHIKRKKGEREIAEEGKGEGNNEN